ncbi:cellulose synthase catalytic subunit [Mycetocola sp. 2940]|uniref:glycosyltransferase family 2 protein n=1 Tax=Mycetocola sp. 2940 TaxID=3156452 RepID=UPI0033917796
MTSLESRSRLSTSTLVTEPSLPHRSAGGNKPQSPSLILLVVIATIGILAYAAFLLNPASRGDWLPYVMVITAESILIAQALPSMWTILSAAHDPRDFAFHQAHGSLFRSRDITRDGFAQSPERWGVHLGNVPVSVDVFITTYGEDLGTIRRTVAAALTMTGSHLTWVLDDGRSDEVKALAGELGARYVRRLGNAGAKAGNVNHALALTRGEFFVILDADFVPHPGFLVETLPFFADEHVAFVQTPQSYGNLHNVISRGAGYMQSVFYRFIQPGRNRFNAAFCVGTNVMLRRAAVDDIGGLYTDSKSEDVWTSLMLHERGWKTVYIPLVLAVGDAPDTIEAYTKQQLRWATGGFEILLRHNLFSRKSRLTLDQRLQYLVTASFYLTGISPLLLLLVPPLEIYFDLRPVHLSTTVVTWLLYYAGFYLMQIVLAFYTMGSFRWETLMLATASFPIYATALFNVLVGKEQKWTATGDRNRAGSAFNVMIPQVLFFAFLLLTSLVAIWRDIDNGMLTLATAWNVTNTLILGGFVATAVREGSRRASPVPGVARQTAQAPVPAIASAVTS